MTKNTPKKKLAEILKILDDAPLYGRKGQPRAKPDEEDMKAVAGYLQPPVTAAFARFGLDSSKDMHWRSLATLLAYVCFGRKRSGAPQKWDEHTLASLLGAVKGLRTSDPLLNDVSACVLLSKSPADSPYSGLSANTLRRKLSEAKANLAKKSRRFDNA